MTCNRFQILLRMWHFADNERSDDDRTFKVRDFMTLILSKFTTAKVPGEDIVIDENMVLFRGRLKL